MEELLSVRSPLIGVCTVLVPIVVDLDDERSQNHHS